MGAKGRQRLHSYGENIAKVWRPTIRDGSLVYKELSISVVKRHFGLGANKLTMTGENLVNRMKSETLGLGRPLYLKPPDGPFTAHSL